MCILYIVINNIITLGKCTLIHPHCIRTTNMETKQQKKKATKTIKFTHYLHYIHRNMSNIGISICTRNVTFGVWRQSRTLLLVYCIYIFYCIFICSPKTITSLTEQQLNSIYTNHTMCIVADTLAVLPVVVRRNSTAVNVFLKFR